MGRISDSEVLTELLAWRDTEEQATLVKRVAESMGCSSSEIVRTSLAYVLQPNNRQAGILVRQMRKVVREIGEA